MPLRLESAGQHQGLPARKQLALAQTWDAFLGDHTDTTIFHLFGWREAVIAGLGFEDHSLSAWDGSELVGVLPLFYVPRFPARSVLVSTPMAVYGGPIARSASVTEALVAASLRLGKSLKVGYVELRGNPNRDPSEQRPLTAFRPSTLHATFRKVLPATPDEILLAIPRKQRAEVRKADKLGNAVVRNRDLTAFYSQYANSVHRLGSPVFPRRFLQALAHAFPDAWDVHSVVAPGNHVSAARASVFTLWFRDNVLPYYAAGSDEARTTSAFPFLYFKLMTHARAAGFGNFDFGRSLLGSGAYDFKRNFGFSPTLLPYEFSLVHAREIPTAAPDAGMYRYATAVWRRLPAVAADRLGPIVTRFAV